MRLLPPQYLHRRTLSELAARTGAYPELSVGDLVARCIHDWDNTHGLTIEGGGTVFGDGSIERGVTTDRAVAAVRAGNDDIEVAYHLGATGSELQSGALDEAGRPAPAAPPSSPRHRFPGWRRETR